jgi:hypothetical protein
MADGYVCSSVYKDICCLEDRIREEAELQLCLGRRVQGVGVLVQVEFAL